MAWQITTTATAGMTSWTLPSGKTVAAGDVVRLVILHGDQQTLDYLAGIDFALAPPNRITWSDLPLVAGDQIVLINYGGNRAAVDDCCDATDSGNVLADGVASLIDSLLEYAAETISYTRGDDEVTLRAVVGRSVFDLETDAEIVEQVQSRDYLLCSAQLKFGSVRTLPTVGDVIVEGTYRYEVLPFGTEPHWRFADPFRKLLRVHTKRL